MKDIRYSEFLFLRAIAERQIGFYLSDTAQLQLLGFSDTRLYLEMAISATEHLHIRFDDQKIYRLGLRLRGDIDHMSHLRADYPTHSWQNPREGLEDLLRSNYTHKVSITYTGLQRIEDLRDMLRRDRILEPFGVLLDIRYFRGDLEDALTRAPDIAVSVLRADMDNFKRINEDFGHEAGDVVMKGYLECIRESLGNFGFGYRGRGDEAVALIVGQGHAKAAEIAGAIKARVAGMKCEYKGVKLPTVTASLGAATAPPSDRTPEVEALADSRQLKAKKDGKNRVVAE